MGVRELWDILSPVKKNVSLEDLRGKVLAIDLSIWIVEANNLLPKHVSKPHLRHLFFRVSHLLQLNILPIIVLEGEPPIIKIQTIQRRLGKEMKITTRSRFRALHRECRELMEALGVPCVQAVGEAEAMCAYLNEKRLVDGVITNDGDAFLYGASVVYTNFSINHKNPCIVEYRMADVEGVLGMDRESLVGIAVLSGCDYLPKGVPGCGKGIVSKFATVLNGRSMLQRFSFWVDNRTSSLELLLEPTEYTVAKKALLCSGFPFLHVIQEYLVNRDKVDDVIISWKRPQLLPFVRFTVSKMEWIERYAVSKLLPLVSLHHMTFPTDQSQPLLRPIRVVKKRVKSGEECYEVMWEKLDGDLYTTEATYTTIERQSLFSSAYPSVTADFQQENAVKKSSKSRSKKNMKHSQDDDNGEKEIKVEENGLTDGGDDAADDLIGRLERIRMDEEDEKAGGYRVGVGMKDKLKMDKKSDFDDVFVGDFDDVFVGDFDDVFVGDFVDQGGGSVDEHKRTVSDGDDDDVEEDDDYVPLKERLKMICNGHYDIDSGADNDNGNEKLYAVLEDDDVDWVGEDVAEGGLDDEDGNALVSEMKNRYDEIDGRMEIKNNGDKIDDGFIFSCNKDACKHSCSCGGSYTKVQPPLIAGNDARNKFTDHSVFYFDSSTLHCSDENVTVDYVENNDEENKENCFDITPRNRRQPRSVLYTDNFDNFGVNQNSIKLKPNTSEQRDILFKTTFTSPCYLPTPTETDTLRRTPIRPSITTTKTLQTSASPSSVVTCISLKNDFHSTPLATCLPKSSGPTSLPPTHPSTVSPIPHTTIVSHCSGSATHAPTLSSFSHSPSITTTTPFSINDYMQSTPIRLTLRERLLLQLQKQ